MNVRAKFIRLVLASAVGSLLWAGCATRSTQTVIHESAGAERPAVFVENTTPFVQGAIVTRQDIAMAPINQLKRRPDTHPELRTGLWQSASPNAVVPPVIEAPVVIMPDEPPVADTTHLLVYEPAVVNIAADRALSAAEPVSEGMVIQEAAGAERPRKFWRWHRRSVTVPSVEVQPAPVEVRPPAVEVQPVPAPQSDVIVPVPAPDQSTPLKNEKDGPLLKHLFVQTR